MLPTSTIICIAATLLSLIIYSAKTAAVHNNTKEHKAITTENIYKDNDTIKQAYKNADTTIELPKNKIDTISDSIKK